MNEKMKKKIEIDQALNNGLFAAEADWFKEMQDIDAETANKLKELSLELDNARELYLTNREAVLENAAGKRKAATEQKRIKFAQLNVDHNKAIETLLE
jgi:hypothetical protein